MFRNCRRSRTRAGQTGLSIWNSPVTVDSSNASVAPIAHAGQPRLPVPIVVYATLGVLDYGFTLAAFGHGAHEANPALRWFADHGLFEFAKLSLTLLVCCIAAYIWQSPGTRRAMLVGNLLMAGVLAYHVDLMFSIRG